jgi:hypothetical protein
MVGLNRILFPENLTSRFRKPSLQSVAQDSLANIADLAKPKPRRVKRQRGKHRLLLSSSQDEFFSVLMSLDTSKTKTNAKRAKILKSKRKCQQSRLIVVPTDSLVSIGTLNKENKVPKKKKTSKLSKNNKKQQKKRVTSHKGNLNELGKKGVKRTRERTMSLAVKTDQKKDDSGSSFVSTNQLTNMQATTLEPSTKRKEAKMEVQTTKRDIQQSTKGKDQILNGTRNKALADNSNRQKQTRTKNVRNRSEGNNREILSALIKNEEKSGRSRPASLRSASLQPNIDRSEKYKIFKADDKVVPIQSQTTTPKVTELQNIQRRRSPRLASQEHEPIRRSPRLASNGQGSTKRVTRAMQSSNPTASKSSKAVTPKTLCNRDQADTPIDTSQQEDVEEDPATLNSKLLAPAKKTSLRQILCPDATEKQLSLRKKVVDRKSNNKTRRVSFSAGGGDVMNLESAKSFENETSYCTIRNGNRTMAVDSDGNLPEISQKRSRRNKNSQGIIEKSTDPDDKRRHARSPKAFASGALSEPFQGLSKKRRLGTIINSSENLQEGVRRSRRTVNRPDRLGSYTEKIQDGIFPCKKHESNTQTIFEMKERSSLSSKKSLGPAEKKDGSNRHEQEKTSSGQDGTGLIEIPWVDNELDLLREAYKEVDPKSFSFWQEVSELVGTRPEIECQEKWFSLVKTPNVRAQKSKKAHSAIEPPMTPNDDDIFNATPMKFLFSETTDEPEESFHNLQFLSNLSLGSAIKVDRQSTEYQPPEMPSQRGYKTYITNMRRNVLKRNMSRKPKAPKISNPKTGKNVRERAGEGDIELNGRLSPGGTLHVKSNGFEDINDGYTDTSFEDEIDPIDALYSY